nr:hypothetical protein [Tanacetum cinerariifolium]
MSSLFQQRSRGSSEGSGVTSEVLDELTLKSSNEGARVIPEVPDEPTDESKKIDVEKDEEEHDGNQRGNQQAGDAQAEGHASKTQSENPKATKVCSRMTLSSVEFTSQFLNDNPDVTVNEVLKDSIEPEVQSMIQEQFHQPNNNQHNQKEAKLRESSRNPRDWNLKSIWKTKKSMLKQSSTPFDQAALDEFDENDKLFQMMSKSRTLLAKKDSKKKKRKDFDAPSSKKIKDHPTSSKKEVMDHEEPVVDKVVNNEEHPQDDDGPSQDMSKWFKQPLKLKTLDLEWSKDPNGDARPEQNWFHELEKIANDPRVLNVSFTRDQEMQPNHRRKSFQHMQILGVTGLTIDNQFRYGYLQEIVVRRAYLKEYSYKEGDFSRLYLIDIEDLFLLYVQQKIHNLSSGEIVQLVNAIRMFTRSIVIQRMVEDVQLGVVYLKESKQKRLMRDDELYKFSDGTLQMVHDNLHDMLHNLVLGYNDDIPTRKWSEKDREWTAQMLKLIDDLLLER